MRIQRPSAYPFLESITGEALAYNSPRHLHEELEIALNTGRSWRLSCRGKTYQIPPGTILITPAEEPHEASSPEQGTEPYIGLRIHPDFIRETFTEMAERPRARLFFSDLLINDRAFYQDLLSFNRALQEQRSRLEQDEYLQHILLDLLRISTDHFSISVAGREKQSIQAAKKYIQEHYQENISLQQLAQQFQFSPFYFSRVFRAEIGLPPHAYQTQIRIRQTKKLLARGVPLAEIAQRTGFSSQSHLGWHFKRLVGLTPGQFAQQCGQD